jgi:hypothetical protein
LDHAGNLFVLDVGNSTIRKITPAGIVTTIAGLAGSSGNTDGTGAAARFYSPYGLAVDTDGNLFVTEFMYNTIRKVTAGGVVTTIAGLKSLTPGSADGPGSTARFFNPTGVATDGAGNIYVVDYGNGTIRKGVPDNVSAAARVVNLSVRSTAGTGAQTLIVGFVITGTGGKTLLLRGVGPTLVPFGVVNAVADPGLHLFNGGTEVAANDDWGGSAAMAANFSAVGAVALPANSKDAALYNSIAGGVYSFHVTANSGPGIALAELYDADAVEGAAKVVNISARTQVGTGENILIAGFVITGSTPKTMLIRGLGPSLVPAGVTGALADPQLNLFNGGTLVGGNDDWGGTPALKDAFAVVGAGALVSDTSKDAALLVTLPPGVYSVQVSGGGNTTGVGLVEIFLMP